MDNEVPGMLSSRLWSTMAVREIGIFFASVSKCFQGQTNKLFRNRDAHPGNYHRFCLQEYMIKGSFSTIDRKHLLRIPVFDAKPLFLFL